MKISKSKCNEEIIKIAYFFMAIDVIIGNLGIFKIVEKLGGYISCIILLIGLMLKFNRREIKKFIIECLLLLLAGISYIFSGNAMIVEWLLFIFVSEDILEKEKMLKYTCIVKMLILIVAVVLYFAGITESVVYYRDGKERRTLGFASPNTLGIIIFSIMVDYIYLRRNKINWRDYLGIVLIGLLIMKFTNSRSIFISSSLLVLMIIFYKLTERKNIKFKIDYLMPILTIASFICMLLYIQNNPIIIKINEIISNRIYIASEYYKTYSIKFWGNKIKKYEYWIGYDQTIDNVYLNLIIIHGILMTIIVNIIGVIKLKRVRKKIIS